MVSALGRTVSAAASSMLKLAPLLGTLAALACGASAEQKPARVAGVEPSNTTQVPTTYVTPDDAGMIKTRFEEANTLLMSNKLVQAAAAFDRITQLEPRGSYAPASLYNAGYAYEQAGQRREALDRFDRLASSFPEAEEARPALARTNGILAYLEDWPRLQATSERLLARPDLSPVERIEALGAHAVGLVEQGEVDKAALSVSRALSLIEDNGLSDAGKLTVGVAQAYFALGEVRRLRSEQLTFTPVPPDFADVLEKRCQGLLDAQDAYSSAMRAYDAHWSAMAGYRVGQLYQQLHRDIMQIAPPATAKTQQQKALFEGAMQLRYRVLLEKGLKMMDRTLAMAERTGEASGWVNRSREAKRDLERTLDQARASVARLPYGEADLQRALDGLSSSKPAP
jgi:tetratricopeptide (TPR) repeat protein